MQKCDMLRYSASEISEGWQLIVDGADDPDPDRRADILVAFRRLESMDRLILVARGQGWTYKDIGRILLGGAHPMKASRFVARAFANLRGEVNG